MQDFCSEVRKGLVFFSEQAVVSAHHDFLCAWQHYKILDNYEEYDNAFFKNVRCYNSRKA